MSTFLPMLSYRHAYHAGNHADVLKHLVLMQLLRYLNQKDAAYMFVDTHAGAGLYALDSREAVKNAEFRNGIGRLWQRADAPPAVAEYLQLIRSLNGDGALRAYPGSPCIADRVARAQDRLRLFELHPADATILGKNMSALEADAARAAVRGKRILVQKADGFDALKSLLPPPSRRALVLIDPPYEVKEDYRRVKQVLDDALKRFATGVYAVWYPILQRMESRQFPDQLKRLPAKDWLHVTLSIHAPTPDGIGLHSSGMFILNPPWTLEPMLRQLMPWLVDALAADPDAGFTLSSSATAPSRG